VGALSPYINREEVICISPNTNQVLPLHLVLEAVKIPVAVVEHLKKQVSEFRLPPEGLFKALILMRLKRIPSERELEREMHRHPDYVRACGLPRAPDHSTFSVFRKRLGDKAEELFKQPLQQLTELGTIKANIVAIDSTDLKAYCRPKKDKPYSDKDASFGHKSKNKTFFGYKAHVICDAETELPIALTVSTGKDSDAKHAIPTINKMQPQHKINMETFLGDGAYYSTEIYEHVIKLQAKPITNYPNRKTKLPEPYNKRISIEHVFSRAIELLGLDNIKVRRIQRVLQHCYLCLTTMLYIALAAVQNNKPWLARSVMQIA